MSSAELTGAVPWPDAAALAGRMAVQVGALAGELDPAQRRAALHPFAGPARRDWHYVPRRRPGLPLRAMRPAQRAATWALVDLVLSAEGAAKARGVLALEAILQERATDKAYRDPENYALALFGLPGPEPWGWRFEGHHLSLTLTVAPGAGVAVTPHFLGANPFSGEVVQGGAHGRLARVLERESALAFELVGGLDAGLLRRATIAADSPADILAGPGRERLWGGGEPEGLPLEAMPEPLRNRAHALLDAFFDHLAPGLARAVAAKARQGDPGAVRFAWAGATAPERGLHYYRLHGPTLLIEYDRTGPDHAHSVWHDPSDPFGDDQLRRHRAAAHGGG